MKAWWLNDYECWAGDTLDEALEAAERETGLHRDSVLTDVWCEADPATRVNMNDDSDDPAGPFKTIGELLATMDKPGFVCGWDA